MSHLPLDVNSLTNRESTIRIRVGEKDLTLAFMILLPFLLL